MNRREAIREYKERTPPRGVFAIRGAGQAWVGSHMNLPAAKNGLWFGLKTGGHINKPLQAAWDSAGEAAFSFEVLETLKEGENPLTVKDTLKARRAHWAAELGAQVLL
jgi:hypothetical protein